MQVEHSEDPDTFTVVDHTPLGHGVVRVALEKRADDHAVEVVGAGPLARPLDKLADANKAKRWTGWL